MKFWKAFKDIGRLAKVLVPFAGIILVVLKYLEGVFQTFSGVSNQNTSERPFKVGQSDGTFTQPKAKPAKKPKQKPTGTTPETGLEIEGEGAIKPTPKPTTTEPTTGELLETIDNL